MNSNNPLENRIVNALKNIEEKTNNFPKTNEINLFENYLDSIFFNLEYSNYLKNQKKLNEFQKHFDEYFQTFTISVQNREIAVNLYGMSGLLLACNILYKNNCLTNVKYSQSKDFTELLLKVAIEQQKRNNYDLFSGSVGNIMVAVSLIEKHEIVEYENSFIDYFKVLEKTAISDKNSNGLKWYSLHPIYKTEIYNLGLSHGFISIVAVLCKIAEKFTDNVQLQTKCKDLLQKITSFVLSNEINFEKHNSFFPMYSLDSFENKIYSSRLAWCYGDLGIAITLLRAAKVLNDKLLNEKAVKILIKNTERKDYKINNIFDLWFCHGTSGIAYMFKKSYELTKNELFKETTEFWISETLNMLEYEDYFEYTLKKNPTANKNNYSSKNSLSLITGYSGIGLVLCSFLYPDFNNSWDEIFLLS
ncbi:MAG: hypothetical protein LBV69_00200 [Bacteroidales bacterium]|jgi:lantibiotic modifying enzyme|nr:hypothetical protein [Bacteroidales bacterium]